MPANQLCSDYLLPDVSTRTACFDTAAPLVGLGSAVQFELNSPIIQGCFYIPGENRLFFSASGSTEIAGSHQFVCLGDASTTTFTTVTATATATTATATSTTTRTTTTVTRTGVLRGTVYSLVDAGTPCSYYLLPDVEDEDDCRVSAKAYVGLDSSSDLKFESTSLVHGCFYSGDVVFFNPSVTATEPSASAQMICLGVATTTTRTSTTTLTTISTLTTLTTTTTTETSTSTLHTTSATETSTSLTNTSTSATTTETSTSTLHTTTATDTSTTSLTGSTDTSTTTNTLPEVIPAGFVGDDPITVYNNDLKTFWLPEGAPALLLQTQEMRVHGDVTRRGAEQWINRISVTGPAGEPVVQIAVKGGIADARWDEGPHDGFETLDVTIGSLDDGPLEAMPPPSGFAYNWGGVNVAVGVVPEMRIGNARPEIVVVDGKTARIVVIPTPAAEFDDQPRLALEYTHLDFVLQVHAKDTCEGILPELWGMRPLSNETRTMLEGPPQPLAEGPEPLEG